MLIASNAYYSGNNFAGGGRRGVVTPVSLFCHLLQCDSLFLAYVMKPHPFQFIKTLPRPLQIGR